MNNCILMAEIIQAPQLRYTSDNQMAVAEFVIQFPGLRPDEAPSQMKVVGWGNLAQEIQAQYQAGDRILLEGRLSMNTVERPEGFREKQAEMTAQRIYRLEATSLSSSFAAASPEGETPLPSRQPSQPPMAQAAPSPTVPAAYEAPAEEPDYDDIPF
ncbi:single-stranded DNA-binding protein [Almyronema epifaneia]|uniref:Single-stranded DNA-binding protein n=1 Tax=Almyronema epifaneia S1 TaxID=2991925 RepID=A0ABW6I9S4_9CYAN